MVAHARRRESSPSTVDGRCFHRHRRAARVGTSDSVESKDLVVRSGKRQVDTGVLMIVAWEARLAGMDRFGEAYAIDSGGPQDLTKRGE